MGKEKRPLRARMITQNEERESERGVSKIAMERREEREYNQRVTEETEERRENEKGREGEKKGD